MAAIKLKWSSLLHLTELEFVPDAPKILTVSDELLQAISWLTAATGHDRRLLRCTENGALLVADPWSLMSVVEAEDLLVSSGSAKTFTRTPLNKGVLLAVATAIVKATFTRISGGTTEVIYIPPATLYWYPHPTESVLFNVVPDPNGTGTYVGVTAFN
ncbi:hypothetical protein ES703_117040 [subsurface metagenome]